MIAAFSGEEYGLLGSAGEADSSQVQHTAAELNALYCATNWIGLAEEDVAYAIEALSDARASRRELPHGIPARLSGIRVKA